MKYVNANLKQCGSQGFSLIELMIAMTIGLIVLGSLAYVLLGSQQINRMLGDTTSMQDSGRNALEMMGRAIRQAGYRADADSAYITAPLSGTEGAGGATDTVTAKYQAQAGGESDCTGAAVVAGGLITEVFAVNANRQLTCNGIVVADNIENLQIEYGVDANSDGSTESYQTAAGVADFTKVTAVRINLLARGSSTNMAANSSQTYTYDGAAVTSNDGFLRQVYTATYTVRNQSK